MTALRSILLTPNILGKDGVSALSREVSRALPAPSLVLSLHDSSTAGDSSADLELRGARGSRVGFLADVARAMPRVTPDTVVVCTHLHLAPAARALAWRGQRATIILCGIEAWVSARPAERWAIAGGEVVAISQHTIDRFKAANPALAEARVEASKTQGGLRIDPVASPTDFERSNGPTALIVARMSAAERTQPRRLARCLAAPVVDHPNAVSPSRVTATIDRARARVAALGITRAVRFLGQVDDDRLDELSRVPLFVMPSRDGDSAGISRSHSAGKLRSAGGRSEIINTGGQAWSWIRQSS
jgi:hypothetical protein